MEKPMLPEFLVFFPFPVKSHFVMRERLMRGLAARGHQVDPVSSFPLKNLPPNYRDMRLADELPPCTNNLTLEVAQQYTSGGIRAILAGGRMNACDAFNSPQIGDFNGHPPTDPPYDLDNSEVPIVRMMMSKLCDWMAQPMGYPGTPAFVPRIFKTLRSA